MRLLYELDGRMRDIVNIITPVRINATTTQVFEGLVD